MSETPSDKSFNITDLPTPEELKAKAQEARKNVPPEVNQAIDKASGFYLTYKQELTYVLIALVFLKLYKRRIQKQTIREALKALEAAGANVSNGSVLPTLFDVMESLRKNPTMAYIPHGGGMVHLLRGRDAMVTIFGDFEKMNDKEIWDTVASVLNLGAKAVA